jgi:hypothetical protein
VYKLILVWKLLMLAPLATLFPHLYRLILKLVLLLTLLLLAPIAPLLLPVVDPRGNRNIVS